MEDNGIKLCYKLEVLKDYGFCLECKVYEIKLHLNFTSNNS